MNIDQTTCSEGPIRRLENTKKVQIEGQKFGCGLDSSGSWQELEVAACEKGTGTSGSAINSYNYLLCQKSDFPFQGIEVDVPPSAEVKERVQLFLYSAPEASWPVPG
jgi:hypothetical protein